MPDLTKHASDIGPFASAVECLGLIAYGRADGFFAAPAWQDEMRERWGELPSPNQPESKLPLVDGLRRILARSAWKLMRPNERCLIGLPRHGILWKIHRAKQANGNKPLVELLESYLRDVGEYRERCAERSLAWDLAAQTLIKAIVEGSVVAYGRRGIWGSALLPETEHQAIPVAFFAHEARTITPDGWGAIDPSRVRIKEMPLAGEPEYGDVKILQSQAARLLRLKVNLAPASSRPSRRPLQPAVDISMKRVMKEAAESGTKKTEPEGYSACRQNFPAERTPTDKQLRQAFKKVPAGHKRRRGERAKSGRT